MAIAIYLRLSKADEDVGAEKDESNSIENQRLLLNTFIENREDLNGAVLEYADDGYSGTNFNRPAFRRMIEDAKSGKISTILVKDLSRLGRDYVTVGDYIEQIFPLLQVRFIAVNNNYDSQKYTSGTMGFDMAVSNLINTFYVRDLSKKTRSANRVRWKNGINLHGAPFGYVKDPERTGKWKIDPEAAKIVRMIFNEALKGRRTSQIAYTLNEKHLPTPGVYNNQHQIWKLGEAIKPENEQLWDRGKVLIILRRYEYTGALVMGKRQAVSIGSHAKRKSPEKDLVIVDDVNEAIITKEEYEEAQKVIFFRRPQEYRTEHKFPLKGIVRCGNCRSCLSYIDRGSEERLYCNHKAAVGEFSDCSAESYLVKDVERQVFLSIQNLLVVLCDSGVQVEKRSEKKLSQIQNCMKKARIEEEKCREEKLRQYEAYANNLITKDTYIKKKQVLNETIEQLQTKIEECQTIAEEESNFHESVSAKTLLAQKFQEEKELSREMVMAFIKNVYVYDKEHIEIVFLNEDLLNSIIRMANEEGDIENESL